MLRCGRRWGKTLFAETLACDFAARGKWVGFFAPAYKITAETFNDIADILAPIKAASSRVDGVFRTTTGGRVDYWTLEDDRAGRSRQYDLVIVDEAAFAKPNMMAIWQRAIEPTLLDRSGVALIMSTPNGVDKENFFWRVCNEPEHGFVEFHAPTGTNPHLPAAEIEKLQREKPPLVYRQEYLAEFVDWNGETFFNIQHCLVDRGDGQFDPVSYPPWSDFVFATIDSASKTGRQHDGTAVIYWARAARGAVPLTVLDWDYVQIEAAMLEVWLPSVFARLEELSRMCKARLGTQGAWIEDQNSGVVLLQQAARRGWPVSKIDSKLTALGKDERAINASPHVYQGRVKISEHAYNKTVVFKQRSSNHMRDQVFTFKLGDKDPSRADDLTDAWNYGVAVALGNDRGF